MPMNILYQDKYLVVAVKPVGVLSEDDPKAACMPALLREHYRALGKRTTSPPYTGWIALPAG